MKRIEKTAKIAGRDFTLSTGDIAEQATRAVMATYGETVVLATVVAADLKADPGYFPLSVEYQERLSAGGKIKGSRWVKRDGKPLDDHILTGRLIDRSIRPLFPKGYKKDVQVIISVLSVDIQNSPDIVAAVAVSAALASSDIPWDGPVGVTRVGKVNGEYVINPEIDVQEKSDLDLVVSATDKATIMIEAGANELEEKEIIEALKASKAETDNTIALINSFSKAVGAKKKAVDYEKPSATLVKKIEKLAGDKLGELISQMATKEAGYAEYDELKAAVSDSFEDDEKKQSQEVFGELFETKIREAILSGKRIDGRATDQLRDLSALTSVLPRTHGSAIFNRGQTQALTVATLGAPSLELTIESAEGEENKRYIHYYSMPPYSVGETGRVGFPKRREVGHGALAERALIPVIPSVEDFSYTIHVVTEILSSNGSSSMASVCGSTLALMDAGVPIKAPVAGIAMGLVIKSESQAKILTDIVGIEDGAGDMDFKVAGTSAGITALQLDVKTSSLTLPLLEKALAQAKDARLEILSVMEKAISAPRKKVSEHAPKIKQIKIDVEKIGELIGPGGKTIKGIIAKTGAQVDVEDDGSVSVSAPTETEVASAIDYIESLTKDVVAGEIYKGVVKRIQPFGAFVEILPGKDGLVYISDMSKDYVKNPEDVVNIGDEVEVRVKEIDKLGRINLSMLLDKKDEEAKKSSGRGGNDRGGSDSRRDSRSPSRAPRQRFDRKYNGPRNSSGSDRKRGPHFPATRLMDSKKDFSR